MNGPAVAMTDDALWGEESTSRRPLTVLMSFGSEQAESNAMIATLCSELSAQGVTVRFFRWLDALFGHFDVFHVHWPEQLLGAGRLRSRASFALALVLLARLQVRRLPVVRTLHNLRPHGSFPLRARLLERALKRLTVATIHLNEHLGPEKLGDGELVILHPLYERLASERSRVAGRLLTYGLVKPYKGFDRVIGAFQRLDVPEAALHLVGLPADVNYANEIAKVAHTAPKVSTDFRFLSELELQEQIASSQLVVLAYKEMFNSGAVLLAMSLNTPVLVPATPVNIGLQREFGADLVLLFDGDLSEHHLREALTRTALAGQSNGHDSVSGEREPARVARLHALLYSFLLDLNAPRAQQRRADLSRKLRGDGNFSAHSNLNASEGRR